MGFIPFNSRDPFFKDKFGSVEAEEIFRLRLCMPRSFGCSKVMFILHNDNGGYEAREMKWASMCGNDAAVGNFYVN